MSADGTLERTVIQCLYFFMQMNLYLYRFPYNISFTITGTCTTESLDLTSDSTSKHFKGNGTPNSHNTLNTIHYFGIYENLSPKIIKNGNQLEN